MRVLATQYSHQHVVLPVSLILPFWLKGLQIFRDLNSTVNIFESFTYVKGAFHLDIKKNNNTPVSLIISVVSGMLGEILDLLEF